MARMEQGPAHDRPHPLRHAPQALQHLQPKPAKRQAKTPGLPEIRLHRRLAALPARRANKQRLRQRTEKQPRRGEGVVGLQQSRTPEIRKLWQSWQLRRFWQFQRFWQSSITVPRSVPNRNSLRKIGPCLNVSVQSKMGKKQLNSKAVCQQSHRTICEHWHINQLARSFAAAN